MSNNAHDLSKRLLNALDNNYNVVDMHTVNEIISILEKINITKELLETTRLGKHVNELRRKTTDPTLARRAKVLVKRWRDLVIPSTATASPGHIGSNRSSAERQTRRLGGTPLTSPALQRHVVSPAVQSPLPPARPTWGGYESDSQDVILVDDDPDPPPPPPLSLPTPAAALLTPPKRPTSPAASSEEKKAKRDKKLKKKRGRGRAGSGSEAAAEWSGRNGSSSAPAQNITTAHATPPHVTTPSHVTTPHVTAPSHVTTPHVGRPRKNGCKTSIDAYTALVHKMPRAGGKKVKTTVELLSEIQSRGSAAVASPPPASPASPDVMLIEPEPSPIRVDSPLRNGCVEPPAPLVPPPPPAPPLEEPRPHHECTCNEEFADEDCPAATNYTTAPLHVRALHEAYLPGINGTRAPPHPHQFAVRKPDNEDYPGLFSSVVPLYKYSDYADDYCVKNMSKVPICTHLKWTGFAPDPPSPPPFRNFGTPRPYPIEHLEIKENDDLEIKVELKEEVKPSESPKAMDVDDIESTLTSYVCPKIEPEMVSVPVLEPSERLKAPILTNEERSLVIKSETQETVKVISDIEKSDFLSEETDHRTVERTKVSDTKVSDTKVSDIDGRTLYQMCETVRDSIPYNYTQTSSTPVVTLPLEVSEAEVVLDGALESVTTELDGFGKPARSSNFTEWHECAQIGDLIALPYVVID